ncbi:MAG: hypothetical protein M1831_007284 [Alyxoria varia]|nr:MAG: hypothetical protein M1831_007284 [Alyxoria varia]
MAPLNTLLTLSFAAFLFGQTALAQCQDVCNGIRYTFNSECGVDPNDGSFLGIGGTVCPCQPEQFYNTITFTGVNGLATTASSTAFLGVASQTTTFTFSYNDIKNTAIRSGSPVSVAFRFPPGGPFSPAPVAYTNSPVSSIFFTDTTTTVTLTEEAVTSHYHFHGYCTITETAATTTITSTSTITPKPKTVKKLKVSFTTTSASCLPLPKSPNKRHIKPRALEPRAINEGVVETAYCPAYFGPPQRTTYTTATAVATATTTTTDTVESIETSTDTTTITPTPLTTTVCSDVDATETTTPTSTQTVITQLKRSTTTSTVTFKFTATIYPRNPKPCGPQQPLPTYKPKKTCPVVPKKNKKLVRDVDLA